MSPGANALQASAVTSKDSDGPLEKNGCVKQLSTIRGASWLKSFLKHTIIHKNSSLLLCQDHLKCYDKLDIRRTQKPFFIHKQEIKAPLNSSDNPHSED